MIKKKREELEKYFLQEFKIHPTPSQLAELAAIFSKAADKLSNFVAIYNKAEKDYIFEDEKCSGCENCDCNKSVCDSDLHNVQVEVDGRCHLCEGTVLVDENIPF